MFYRNQLEKALAKKLLANDDRGDLDSLSREFTRRITADFMASIANYQDLLANCGDPGDIHVVADALKL